MLLIYLLLLLLTYFKGLPLNGYDLSPHLKDLFLKTSTFFVDICFDTVCVRVCVFVQEVNRSSDRKSVV